jgi:membrane-associated phospholipid phosphatase
MSWEIRMAAEQGTKWRSPVLVGSSVIALGLCLFSYHYLDIRIAYYCNSIAPPVKNIFEHITGFGKSTWYLVGSVLFFLYFKFIRINNKLSSRSMFVFLAIVISGVITDIIKYILGRYRPEALFQQDLYGFVCFQHSHSMTSFPSGHANTITAFMFSLYLIYPRYWLVFFLVALLVMASRIVICAHYLSDVVFGAYLAILSTLYIRDVFIRRNVNIASVTPQ